MPNTKPSGEATPLHKNKKVIPSQGVEHLLNIEHENYGGRFGAVKPPSAVADPQKVVVGAMFLD
jgi:hypothetical protein